MTYLKVSYCRIKSFGLLILWLLVGPVYADVTFAPLFRDGVVLQRDRPIPVWGWADPGVSIKVIFHGESIETRTGDDGRWQVTLKARPASGDGMELVVIGRETVRIRDVLVGDVWLCGGQSNMAFTVYRGLNAEAEIGAANFPLIRHFLVPRRVADHPAYDSSGEWVTCHPDSVANFSGVGYFFARDLHLRNNVPIGLVNATWGGTQIEGWMSMEALRADPSWPRIERRWQSRLENYPARAAEHIRLLAAWQAQADAAREGGVVFDKPAPPRAEGPMSRWMPAGLYNAMIAPLVPMPFRGVIWYQGEANAPRAHEYASLFHGLIRQWRTVFGAGMPFYFVQLANHDRKFDQTRKTWAYLREAQQEALVLPFTGMVVTIDIGDVDDVHPKNKQEVGRRLALIARNQLDGETVNFSGPIFKSAHPDGRAIRVKFHHASGLNSRNMPIVGVEVAGADKVFYPAMAQIEGDTLLASTDSVHAPEAIRYAWHNFPVACLFNGDGLPAAPFRSHRWD